ncbi:MAG TPA: hypothetical protein VGC65_03130 [Bacteroidia bacterium]
MKKLFYVTLVTCFLSACAQKTSNYNFESASSVKIDESKVVLTRFPSVLTEIDDSTIAAINSLRKLSIYNIYSGKNIANFTTEKIKFDSLIRETFQKKYEGRRQYIYDEATAGGLSEGNSQVLFFYYSDNTFYIYVNTLAQVNYINDPAELLKYSENEKIKELKKESGDVNLQIMQYLEFVFVVDKNLRLQKILPLYEKTQLKNDKYSPFYQKGFAVSNSKLFVPIQKDDQSFEKITSQLKWESNLNTLAVFDLKNDQKTDYRLGFKDIDFNDFSLHDYFSSAFVFRKNTNGLSFSNGKDICEIESGKKLFSKKQLRTNEWIQSYQMDDNQNLILVTYTLDKNANPTEFEKNYGLDSLSSIQLRTFNTQSMEWGNEKALPTSINLSMLVTHDKLIYFDKDEENYYLKFIPYHEN